MHVSQKYVEHCTRKGESDYVDGLAIHSLSVAHLLCDPGKHSCSLGMQ